MKFKEIPPSKAFRTYRAAQFKVDDEIKNMAFSDRIDISMEISRIYNEETRKALEELADRMMEEAKKIIAEHEEPR